MSPITNTYVIPLYSPTNPEQTAVQLHVHSYSDCIYMVFVYDTRTNEIFTHGVFTRGETGRSGTYTYRKDVQFPYANVCLDIVSVLRKTNFSKYSLTALGKNQVYRKIVYDKNNHTKCEFYIHKNAYRKHYTLTSSLDNHRSVIAAAGYKCSNIGSLPHDIGIDITAVVNKFLYVQTETLIAQEYTEIT